MTAEKLLKTLPHLQAQIDSLLEFDCSAQVRNRDHTKGEGGCGVILEFRSSSLHRIDPRLSFDVMRFIDMNNVEM